MLPNVLVLPKHPLLLELLSVGIPEPAARRFTLPGQLNSSSHSLP